MSRVPARPRSGRLCPDFCIKIKVCEAHKANTRTHRIEEPTRTQNKKDKNTITPFFLTVFLNVSIFCLPGLLCRLLLSACTQQHFSTKSTAFHVYNLQLNCKCPEGTKVATLRCKIEKKFLGRGHCPLPRPLPSGEGTPPSHTSPPSAPWAPRFSRLRRLVPIFYTQKVATLLAALV